DSAAVSPAWALDLLADRLCCGGGLEPGGTVARRVLVILHGGRAAAVWHGRTAECRQSVVEVGTGAMGGVHRPVALAVALVHARQHYLTAGQYPRHSLGQPAGGARSH